MNNFSDRKMSEKTFAKEAKSKCSLVSYTILNIQN